MSVFKGSHVKLKASVNNPLMYVIAIWQDLRPNAVTYGVHYAKVIYYNAVTGLIVDRTLPLDCLIEH